jgi:hypothetical protein
VTAVCGGGNSEPQPGLAPAIFATTATLAGILSFFNVSWATGLALYLASKTYDLPTFCAIDPPADPGFTAADAIALLDVYNPLVGAPAATKLQQLVDRYAWYQFCHCQSTTTPAAPSAPTAPTGLPQLNPPNLPNPSSPCSNQAAGPVAVNPANRSTLLGNSGSTAYVDLPIPLGATSAVYTVTNTSAGAVHGSISFTFQGRNAAGGFPFSSAQACLSGVSAGATVQIPSTTTRFTLDAVQTFAGATISDTASCAVQFFCGGATPTQGPSACCPPDPVSTGLLQQILGLVTLIQRQAVPFAYVTKTAHSGLTGAGTISINGILGVKVDVTTLPSSLGVTGTTPAEYFDLGWVSLGTPDGYPQSYRLEHNPQLLLPARCSANTDLAYDLHPGVVVTITELAREP